MGNTSFCAIEYECDFVYIGAITTVLEVTGTQLSTKLTKTMRTANKLILLLGIIGLLSSCGGGKSDKPTSEKATTANFAGKTLNILCWEGYAHELFTKPFRAKIRLHCEGNVFWFFR
ncbi:MAG: hypothetical protein RML35_14145 [Chloroherpetonaceae bacterium]|nr:hypothetical protein [Chloroherpetonaceae bacterium]